MNLLLIFTFYFKYLCIEIIHKLGNKTVVYLICNRIYASVECKTEKRNSQCDHAHPMEQTRGLFCSCDFGVARCQSQQLCHFWRMNSMFEVYCTGK